MPIIMKLKEIWRSNLYYRAFCLFYDNVNIILSECICFLCILQIVLRGKEQLFEYIIVVGVHCKKTKHTTK